MIQKAKDKIFDISQKWGKKIGLDLPYFVKNGLWVGFRQAIAAVSGLALYVIFARFLSKEIFGQYQFILSVWAVVSICSITGLNTSLMTAVASCKDGDYKRVVKKSFLWSLIGIPILWMIGGYYLRTEYLLGISFLVTSAFFPFFYAFNTWDSFFQGKSRFDISAWYFSIQAIVNVFASVLAVLFYRNNLLILTSVYLFTFTFFNILYYYKSLKYIENEKKDEQVFKYGWFLTKINALGIVAENIDKLILAVFLSPAALAVYLIVSIFPVKMRDVIKPFVNIFFPKFVVLNSCISTAIKEKKKLVLIFVGALISLAVIYYFSIVAVNYLFFGSNYGQYYTYSKYFVVFFTLYVPLTLMVRYAQSKRMDSIIIFSDSAYYIIKIISSVVFILWFGILGAIIAFNLSFLLWFIFYSVGLFFKKTELKKT